MIDTLRDAFASLGDLTPYAWIGVALLLSPFVALGYWLRVFPQRRATLLFLVPVVSTAAVLYDSGWFAVVLTLDLLLVVVAFVDLWSLPKRTKFAVDRETLRVASLGKPHRVTLTISNLSSRRWTLTVRDDVPQEFVASPEEFTTKLAGRSRATMHYELRAVRRGAFTLPCVHLKILSLLGLWHRHLILPVESQVHVYPDLKQLSEYAILARTNRLSLMGVRRVRKVGQDHDFERLRDYTPDDNYKHIDWRTTARRNRLTVKDFQTSQSQRIIFLLDCGRMMANEARGISLLDHSLNAALMLSHVALKQGDSVGLICFSDRVHSFVPPRGGMAQMNRMLHATFDRFPEMVESRYDSAFLHLSQTCKKRSLVVLITNVIDEVNAHQIHGYLANQVGKHLPLGVLLRDDRLFQAVENPEPHGAALYRAAAAADILTWRHSVIGDLTRKGVLCLDVFPYEMTAPLVNKYLDIKARHLL